MDIDSPTEVGPIEEIVDALMEYLVGPLLPLKHNEFAKVTPSESKQKSVAKQVHAAVVLYNYYHLNYHQESEFFKFDQFCKLATVLKPGILHHMKHTCQSDQTILDDPENQLSITEKAIMDACTISETLLNASTNISSVIKEWPITKVAVLLIDSKKENCFLQFNNGVWSVIEKEVYPESKKRKKITTGYDIESEVGFQKLAFTAVKEVAGIAFREVKILESHVVYSLSQAKTATRFYIVQSTKEIGEDNLVPIQDVISSLQGPVVKKCLGSWAITPVVEYYYLLPYAEILSKIFSREVNNLPHQVKEGSADVNIIQGSQKSIEKESGGSKKVPDNLQKKSKLISEIVHKIDSSKEKPNGSKDIKTTYESNAKKNGESKEVSDNLRKKSKLISEIVHNTDSSKEIPNDSKDCKDTYQSNKKESGQSKEVCDNVRKKSKLDSELVHISSSSKEEPHDGKDIKSTYEANQCSEKERGQSTEVSNNVQKKSKLDSELVNMSNSVKEEPCDCKDSKIIYNSNQSSEKENGEMKKVSDNLQKMSKLNSETVHMRDSSKEESHESKVSKNGYDSNQFSYTFEADTKVADDAITPQFTARSVDQKVKETENSIDNSITVSSSDGRKQEDMNGSCKAELNESSSGADSNMDTDKLLVCFQKENQNAKVQRPLKVYHHKKRPRSTNSTHSKEANVKDLKIVSTISQSKDEMVNGAKECCVGPPKDGPKDDKSLAVNYILEDFHSSMDAKKSELSDAALRALLYKRQKLYDQQRVIESDLTLCDKKIQAIMHGGIGDCLDVKLQAVIDCCNEICKQDGMQQTQQHTNMLVSRSVPLLAGKSLSEAQLTLRNASQELDVICLSNNWMLPTYCTSSSDGGFVANVTVKGANFECSGVSGSQPSIQEARNSAATHVIMRLHQMASGMKTTTLV